MAEQDRYDPSKVFENEEDDVLLAKMALDNLIRDTAVKALNEGLRVKVTTPDETFTGYVQTVTEKDETHLIDFTNCRIPNEPYEYKRQYFSFGIDELITIDENSQDSDFDILTQPNPTQGTPMESQESQITQESQTSPELTSHKPEANCN
jgi:hypothetical protein